MARVTILHAEAFKEPMGEFAMVHVKALISVSKLNSDVLPEVAKTCHLKFALKHRTKSFSVRNVISSKVEMVHIKNKDNPFLLVVRKLNIPICRSPFHARTHEASINLIVPGMASLFQAIQGLV